MSRTTPGRCRLRCCAAVVSVLALGACTPPIRQFDLNNQKLTCEQANQYSYRTLESMGFAITEFKPAVVGHSGAARGTREDRGTQAVTVVITCNGSTADVYASEDGKYLGQLEFRRGFYLGFTATAAQAAMTASAARAEAERPIEQKKSKGLNVLIQPVRGLGAKLDFDLDLAAAGVLPVQITITNATLRTYTFDPDDIVLAQKDGTRVHPLALAEAAQRVADAERQKAASNGAAPDGSAAVAQRLTAHVLTARAVAANQTIKGYLYFPLNVYVKGRVSLEDKESEETEGFVVEF